MLFAAIGTGVLAGAAHVVAGADHMAVLLPLSIGRRLRAFHLGARWGFGHSVGVAMVGALILVLRDQLDLNVVGAWGERVVGVMLIGIGLVGLRHALRIEIHSHTHDHGDGEAHAHLYLHVPEGGGNPAHTRAPHRHDQMAFFAGSLHGVAGTAHVLGVLPALALPGIAASAAYLIGFVFGTMLAMGVFAALVGWLSAGPGGGPRRLRATLAAANAVTVAVGAAWLVLPTLGYDLPELL